MDVLPLPPTLTRLVKQCKRILGKPANLMSRFVTHVDGVQLTLMEHEVAKEKDNTTASYIKEDKVTTTQTIHKLGCQLSLSLAFRKRYTNTMP